MCWPIWAATQTDVICVLANLGSNTNGSQHVPLAACNVLRSHTDVTDMVTMTVLLLRPVPTQSAITGNQIMQLQYSVYTDYICGAGICFVHSLCILNEVKYEIMSHQ